ncbi:MAG: fasciclin domain-containing protein [Bacteroidota bacterium]
MKSIYIRASLLFAFLLCLNTSCLETEPQSTIFDALQERGDFDIFLEAVQIVGFDNALRNGSPITVFAPTDDAFASFLSDRGISTLSEIDIEELRDIVLYHLLGTTIPLSGLRSAYFLTPSTAGNEGNFVAIYVEDVGNGEYRLNGTANVILKDQNTFGGFYNSIDQVLELPTIFDMLEQNEDFSLMLAGINSSPEVKTILTEEDSSHTFLLVPDEDLEEDLSATYGVSSLTELSEGLRDSLLKAHTLPGYFRGQDLGDPFAGDFETLLEDFNISVVGSTRLILNEGPEVSIANIQAKNGVIHTVNGLLSPK